MNDDEKYQRALATQKMMAQWAKVSVDRPRHLGPVDERCPHCGDLIETLLSTDGKNPLRMCWRCEIATLEAEHARNFGETP